MNGNVTKMKEEDFEKFEQIFAAFPFALIQDFVTFSTHMKKHNVTMDQIKEYVLDRVIAQEEGLKRMRFSGPQVMQRQGPRCPECKAPLMLEPINNTPARMVDDHSRSWWVCPNLHCEYEPELTDKPIWEVLSDLGVPIRQRVSTKESARRKNLATRARAKGRGFKI